MYRDIKCSYFPHTHFSLLYVSDVVYNMEAAELQGRSSIPLEPSPARLLERAFIASLFWRVESITSILVIDDKDRLLSSIYLRNTSKNKEFISHLLLYKRNGFKTFQTLTVHHIIFLIA